MLRTTTRGLAALACLTSFTFAQSPFAGGPDSQLGLRKDSAGHAARALLDAPPLAPRGGAAKLVDSGWSPVGPFGGDIADVSASPTDANLVLAGIAPGSGFGGGLFLSADAGATWSEVAALSGTAVYDIEFDPAGKIYLGTSYSVWSSLDNGVSWTTENLGIGPHAQTLEITIDPANSQNIWAGVADAMGGQTVNVLLSNNGGRDWADKTPPGAAGMSCRGIALDPGNSSEVFAVFGGSFGGGMVWHTSDSGGRWTDRSAGLPANPMNDVVHEGTRAMVVGGQLYGSQTVGLYATLDDGATWTAMHDSSWPNLVIHDIELDPTVSGVIYLASAGSGVYKSTTAGATWNFGIGGTGNLSVNEVSVDPTGNTPVYLGASSAAVWKSSDALTFAPSSFGIGSLNVVSVAANPLDAQELAAAYEGANDGGVFTSRDGGSTWQVENLPGTRYHTVKFSPPGVLYALSDGPSSIAPEGVYRRDPSGWVNLGPDQGIYFETELWGIAFSETNPNLIVITGSDFGYAGNEPTIWTTTDGGVRWTKTWEPAVDHEDVRDVVILADGTDQKMVASFIDMGSSPQTGGALYSTDGGGRWTAASGLYAEAQGYALAVSPFDTDTVFLADGATPAGSVARSVDGGATWTNLGHRGNARAIVTDPRRPDRLYVGQGGDPKVVYSDDAGVRASDFDEGLESAGWMQGLALVPGDPCHRLLMASSNGVWSHDEAGCVFEGSTETLAVRPGGTLDLSLAVGPEHAGRWYFVVGSLTGTAGTPFGSITLPLTYDQYTFNTIVGANGSTYVNTFATLDGDGRAVASIVLVAGADPALIGLEAWHAAAIFTLGPLITWRATNAQRVTIVP